MKGGLYWLESGRSGLKARVLAKDRDGSDSGVTYLSVKRSPVLKVLLKYVKRYNSIRESLETGDVPCIIGSGRQFER